MIDFDIAKRACEATMQEGKKSFITKERLYKSKHSPIYTQYFWIEIEDIKTFVSTHLVRHGVGVTHFVRSNRPDLGGNGGADRHTRISHSMFINAMALIQMSHKRLCYKASPTTRETWLMVREAVEEIDPALAKHMILQCCYLGRCDEDKSCGYWGKYNAAL